MEDRKTLKHIKGGRAQSCKNPNIGNSPNKATKVEMEAKEPTMRYHREFPPNIEAKVEQN